MTYVVAREEMWLRRCKLECILWLILLRSRPQERWKTSVDTSRENDVALDNIHHVAHTGHSETSTSRLLKSLTFSEDIFRSFVHIPSPSPLSIQVLSGESIITEPL